MRCDPLIAAGIRHCRDIGLHGPTSPAILITTSRELAESLPAEIERQLKVLPTADVAGQAWRDYGQIILVDSLDEAVTEADAVAAEHVEILTRAPRYFLERMRRSRSGATLVEFRRSLK